MNTLNDCGNFLKVLFCAFLIFWSGTISASNKKTNNRPNIILYVVDDLGTNDAGCYGNPFIKTPGIDALAEAGTRFTHAFCTSPSCSASRSVILTGLHNHANGQYGHSHGKFHFSAFSNIKSLPVMLEDEGYRTMHIGKFHVAPLEVFQFQNQKENSKEKTKKISVDERIDQFISDDSGSPFFLYYCTMEPHRPFKRHGSDTIRAEDIVVPNHLPDIPAIRSDLAKYYMSAQRADKGLLNLIEKLKRENKWDNTIILFTSDNGRPFMGAKLNLYEPGIRLPFVLRNPFQKRHGIVSDAMISFTDITPTLLDLAGVDISKLNFHGRSIKSQLNKEKSIGFDTIYASHTFHETTMYYPMRMIRDRRYKLIWNLAYGQPFPLGVSAERFAKLIKDNQLAKFGKRLIKDFLQRPKFELYDLINDPDEVNNLAYNLEYQHLVNFYKSKLYDFQKNTDDLWKVYQDYDELEKYLIEITK